MALIRFVCRSCVCWWGVPGNGTRLQSDENGERMVLYVRGAHQKKLCCSIHRNFKVNAKPINNISVIIAILLHVQKLMSFHYQIFAVGTVVYNRHFALLIRFFFFFQISISSERFARGCSPGSKVHGRRGRGIQNGGRSVPNVPARGESSGSCQQTGGEGGPGQENSNHH